MIAVFVLDDHEIVRQGLIHLIDSEADMHVIGEARTAAEALARAPHLDFDVAVLDVRLPDGSGVEVCRELRSRRPELACLMLTSFADDDALLAAATAGAAGYVTKEVRGMDLLHTIRRVAAGERLLDSDVIRSVVQRLHDAHQHDSRLERLSQRELMVLELIGEGLTNRQIASRVFLAEKTVKNYVSSMLAKTQLHTRTQAALFIADQHLHDDPTP